MIEMLGMNPSKLDFIMGAIILLLVSLMIYNHRKASHNDSQRTEGLGVTELIENVKAELIKSEQNRITANQAALFEIKDFDLEIKFVVSTRRTSSGTLEYKVVTVGGETEVSSERVQTIKLHMTAIPPEDFKQKVSPKPLETEPEKIITHSEVPTVKERKEQ